MGFFVLTIIVVNIYNYNSLQKVKSNHKNGSFRDKELLLEEVRDNIYRNQVFDFQLINQNTLFYDPVSLQKISVFDVIDNSVKLVLRVSSDGCEECNDRLINQLIEISEYIGSKSIVILTDFSYPRQMGIFVREHNIDFRVYSIPKFDLGKELDKYTPYFFTLNGDLIMRNLFFPFHINESLNKDYLLGIAKVCF